MTVEEIISSFNFDEAYDQIFNWEASVRIPKLSDFQLTEVCPPGAWRSRRNAKRKHDKLDFDRVDDDDLFFSMVCDESTAPEPVKPRPKRKKKVEEPPKIVSLKQEVKSVPSEIPNEETADSPRSEQFETPLEEAPSPRQDVPPDESSTLSRITHQKAVVPSLHTVEAMCKQMVPSAPTVEAMCKPMVPSAPTVEAMCKPMVPSAPTVEALCKSMVPSTPTMETMCKPMVPSAPTMETTCKPMFPSASAMEATCSSFAKLRVKSAAELGMWFAFVDEKVSKKVKPVDHRNFLESAFSSSACANNLPADSIVNKKLDMRIIGRLYKKYLTTESQEKIRCVAKMLRDMDRHKEESNKNIEKVQKSKSSEAEKLMLRHQTYGELKRKRTACANAIREQLSFLDRVNDNELELLFQFLFLSIMNLLTSNATPYNCKRGALFKAVSKELSNCFETAKCSNNRLVSIMKKSTFRTEVMTLFQFLKKNKGHKYFEFSESRGYQSEGTNESRVRTSGHTISIDKVDAAKLLPCGNHLLVPLSKVAAAPVKTKVVPNIGARPPPLVTSLDSIEPPPLVPSNQHAPSARSNQHAPLVPSNQHAPLAAGNQHAQLAPSNQHPQSAPSDQHVLKYTVKLNGPTVTLHPEATNLPLNLQNPTERTRPSVPSAPVSNPVRYPPITPFAAGATTVVANQTSVIKGPNSTPFNSLAVNATRNSSVGLTHQSIRAAPVSCPNVTVNYSPFNPIPMNRSLNHPNLQQVKSNNVQIAASRGKNNENQVPMLTNDTRPPVLKDLATNVRGSFSIPEYEARLSGYLNNHQQNSMTQPPRSKQCAHRFCQNEATVICGGCNKAYYCGNSCQQLDWMCEHHRVCSSN